MSKVLGHGVAVLRQLSGGRFFFKYIPKQPRVDQETFLKCKSNRKSRGRILSFATKASRIISLITQKVKVKLFYHNDCLDCKIHRGYHTVARRYEFYFRVAKQYFTNERSQ